MGTWISHLRIAENLLTQVGGLDETAFLFGNLAPDSGKPNEDWTEFDPPKEVTHYLEKGKGEGHIRDVEFYRQYLQNVSPEADLPRYSFLLGYFFHLLCDSIWAKRIGSASKRDYKSLIDEKGIQAWGEMKEDWYGLDQKYVRDNRTCIFWRVMMPALNPPTYLPYLPEDALHQQMDYIRHFYSEPDGWELDRRYPYLNETTMARFVADSTQTLLEIYAKRGQLAGLTNHSALSLIAAETLRPYDAPLGDKTL